MPRFKAVSGCEEPAPVADIRDLRAGPPRSSASGGLCERQRGPGPLHVEPSGPGGLQPRVSLFSDLASGVPGDHLTLRMGKLRQSAGKEATGLVARLCPRGAPPRWKTGRREFTTWPRPRACEAHLAPGGPQGVCSEGPSAVASRTLRFAVCGRNSPPRIPGCRHVLWLCFDQRPPRLFPGLWGTDSCLTVNVTVDTYQKKTLRAVWRAPEMGPCLVPVPKARGATL